jgi:hypothetical protein
VVLANDSTVHSSPHLILFASTTARNPHVYHVCQVQIVKKLKLTGHPYKIFKNTAYIRDMFHSSLEVCFD